MKEEKRRQKQIEANFDEEYFEDHGGGESTSGSYNCVCVSHVCAGRWEMIWLLFHGWGYLTSLGVRGCALLWQGAGDDFSCHQERILEHIPKLIISLEWRLTCCYKEMIHHANTKVKAFN